MSRAASSVRSASRVWVGCAIATACLVWVLHDINWTTLCTGIVAMRWWLLLPAVAADIGSYVTQAARWSVLLRPLGRITVLQSTQAIYSALFTNEVLPLRVGEVLRGYLASRWTAIPVTQVFSSIAAERFLDGLWMALAFGVVVITVPLPRYLVEAEEALALVLAGTAAVLATVLVWRRNAGDTSESRTDNRPLRMSVSGWLAEATAALHLIGSSRSLYVAALLSAVLLILQALSFWLVMKAYHLPLSMWHGAAVFLIVHLGVIVPGAPSNVGTYQFFTVLGLMLFGIDKSTATGFSVIVFLTLTIPLWIIGLFAFWKSGLDLQTVREHAGSVACRFTSGRGEISPHSS